MFKSVLVVDSQPVPSSKLVYNAQQSTFNLEQFF